MRIGYFDQHDEEWIVPVADKTGSFLNLGKGKRRSAREKYTNRKRHFSIERVIWAQETKNPETINVLQELLWEDNRIELRFGYYTTSKRGNWWWGQFAVMTTKSDFNEIIRYAQEKQML